MMHNCFLRNYESNSYNSCCNIKMLSYKWMMQFWLKIKYYTYMKSRNFIILWYFDCSFELLKSIIFTTYNAPFLYICMSCLTTQNCQVWKYLYNEMIKDIFIIILSTTAFYLYYNVSYFYHLYILLLIYIIDYWYVKSKLNLDMIK